MEGKTVLDCETIDGRADMSAPLDEDAAPLPSVVAASLSILCGGTSSGLDKRDDSRRGEERASVGAAVYLIKQSPIKATCYCFADVMRSRVRQCNFGSPTLCHRICFILSVSHERCRRRSLQVGRGEERATLYRLLMLSPPLCSFSLTTFSPSGKVSEYDAFKSTWHS